MRAKLPLQQGYRHIIRANENNFKFDSLENKIGDLRTMEEEKGIKIVLLEKEILEFEVLGGKGDCSHSLKKSKL